MQMSIILGHIPQFSLVLLAVPNNELKQNWERVQARMIFLIVCLGPQSIYDKVKFTQALVG